MKLLFIIAVIAGILLLSGIPCFADSGSGVSIELETTVVQGDSGSGSYSGGNIYFPLPKTTPVAPVVEPEIVPPVTVTNPYVPPPPSNPLPQVAPIAGVPMPAEQSTIHLGWFLLGGGILAIGLMGWYLLSKKRKPKNLENELPR